MDVQQQIDAYIAAQTEPKRADMRALHERVVQIAPGCQLWFLDGTDGQGKIVTNPNIGYGVQTMHYAGGNTREFYRVGISGNSGGISVYIMGLDDKTYLKRIYGERLGKASITGYCIKFKALKDIDVDVLCEAVRYGLERA